jgi:hypothetical protein
MAYGWTYASCKILATEQFSMACHVGRAIAELHLYHYDLNTLPLTSALL